MALILIIKEGCQIAQDFGFGSALRTLIKGLDVMKQEYTLDQGAAFDVIVANDYESSDRALDLKLMTGKPLIASIHLAVDNEKEHELIKSCDGVIVYSKLMKDYIKTLYPKLTVPIEVVKLGIDTDVWQYKRNVPEDFLLFIGRTKAENKNCLSLIEACLKENVPFRIAGDLEYGAADFNYGYLKPDQLSEVYGKAALHVLPSIFEPFGLVTLEAMASGCPVAVSTKSGVSEQLNDGVAIFFDPTKPFSVKDFMEQAKKFDTKAVSDYARQFDHVFHAKSFVNAVQTILSNRSDIEIEKEISRGDYDVLPVKDCIVVDIGAYKGETAVHFSKQGAKEVIAIEPFPSFHEISINARLAGCTNISAFKSAVGLSDGHVYIDDAINTGETRLSERIKEKGEKIPIISMNTLIESIEAGYDIFIKMDCEGGETSMFTASKENMRKVKYFVIEAHENIRRGIAENLAMFIAGCGFRVSLKPHGENVSMIYAIRN